MNKEGLLWNVTAENGTLTIGGQHTSPWLARLARIDVGGGPLILELPGGGRDSLQIDATSGDIALKGIRAGTLSVAVTSGNVLLDGTDTDAIAVKCTSGDVTAVLPTGKAFDVHTTSGDVTIAVKPEGGV